MGYVDLIIFVAMMPAVMIAAPIGVRTGHLLSEAWLRRSFTILLFIIAVDLIAKLAHW
ncbi:MAG: TSUP family transporter [Xanthobacteraceae bacterium]